VTRQVAAAAAAAACFRHSDFSHISVGNKTVYSLSTRYPFESGGGGDFRFPNDSVWAISVRSVTGSLLAVSSAEDRICLQTDKYIGRHPSLYFVSQHFNVAITRQMSQVGL